MKSAFALLALALVLLSCASHQPGTHADVVGGDHPPKVPITAYLDPELGSTHFSVVQVTFGNQNDDWVRVKEIVITLPETGKNYVVLGDDLLIWARSTKEKIAIEQHNSQMFLAGVMAAGAIVASAAKGDSAGLGLGTMVAAGGVLVGQDAVRQIRKLNRGGMVPEGHLLAPSAVPPGLVARRWLVLQTPPGQVLTQLSMKVRYLDGREADYQAKL